MGKHDGRNDDPSPVEVHRDTPVYRPDVKTSVTRSHGTVFGSTDVFVVQPSPIYVATPDAPVSLAGGGGNAGLYSFKGDYPTGVAQPLTEPPPVAPDPVQTVTVRPAPTVPPTTVRPLPVRTPPRAPVAPLPPRRVASVLSPITARPAVPPADVHKPNRVTLPRDPLKKVASATNHDTKTSHSVKHTSPEKVRDNVACNRPDDNRPRRGGGGGSKQFIPWEKKGKKC